SRSRLRSLSCFGRQAESALPAGANETAGPPATPAARFLREKRSVSDAAAAFQTNHRQNAWHVCSRDRRKPQLLESACRVKSRTQYCGCEHRSCPARARRGYRLFGGTGLARALPGHHLARADRLYAGERSEEHTSE